MVSAQNQDGGWGAAPCGKVSSVEETALAIEGLLAAPTGTTAQVSIEKGLEWLMDAVEVNQHHQSTPIGFYFAKLWYYEKLYPLVAAQLHTSSQSALLTSCRSM